MKFEWDPQKENANVKKHGISFEHSALVFNDKNMLSVYDEEHSLNEDRWITMGCTPSGEIIVVSHTYRKTKTNEVIRIISSRKAVKAEVEQYFQFSKG